jgi:5-(carboxyamino)imidazole ribonucleotide synthase
MFISPAQALGVELLNLADGAHDVLQADAKRCDVVTIIDKSISSSIAKSLEADGVTVRPSFTSLSSLRPSTASNIDSKLCVMVARSPHGQATTWALSEIISNNDGWLMSITPAPAISESLQEKAQQLALDTSAQLGAVGVMAVEISIQDEIPTVVNVEMHPHDSGNWTVDGAVTSQYEQHLRAVLDLPLGDPAMTSPFIVTGNVYCGEKPNMYRPYLHLMARTPAMKFHQYKNSAKAGELVGHVTLAGDDLHAIIEEVKHAQEYMQGVIDE